jgi:menaquinone-dependent protoporphyrinogen IX oxidase
MNSLVIYESRYGNTEKIAYAIAAGLRAWGTVEALPAEKALGVRLHGYDLVVIGGPTEGHGITEPMSSFVDKIGEAFTGVNAAAFDTRLTWPKWMSGSAAGDIAKRLEGFGASLLAQPTSFLVAGRPPALEPGELERAEGWARSLAARVETATPAT